MTLSSSLRGCLVLFGACCFACAAQTTGEVPGAGASGGSSGSDARSGAGGTSGASGTSGGTGDAGGTSGGSGGLASLGGGAGSSSVGGSGAAGSAGAAAGGTAGTVGTAGAGGVAGSAGAGGVAGAGGAAGAGGSGNASATCPNPPLASAKTLLQFDDSQTAGMYVYSDASGGGTTSPPNNAAIASGIVNGGAGGTGKSFDFTGMNFKASAFGGGVGVTLPCADGSSINGIRVWLKSNVAVAITVSIPADTAQPQGDCVGDALSCVSPNHIEPSTGGTWAQVSVPWASLGNGKPQAFSATRVSGVGFGVQRPAGATDGWGWDVAIDELSFY